MHGSDMEDVCEICGTYGRHEECDEKARRWQAEEQARLKELAVNGKFGPQSSNPSLTLEEAIQLVATDLGEPREVDDVDVDRVIENERWWFVPSRGIGMLGSVVDKATGAITYLGGGLGRVSKALELYESGRLDPSGRQRED